MSEAKTPFLSDVKTLRERAKQHLGRGAVTSTYTCLLYTSPSPRD